MQRKRLSIILDETRRLVLLVAGALISAAGFSLFQVPYNIAAGGVSGIAILINHFTGWPVSALYLLMNVPLFVLGFFYLGRWRFFFSTALVVLLFSFATGWFNQNLPLYLATYPITDNVLLSAIWAGLVGGIGGGLVYWAGATLGGTAIVGRVIQVKTGPLAQPDLPLCGRRHRAGRRHHLRLGDRPLRHAHLAACRPRHRLCA